jgi:hypothetical protein
LPYYIRRDAEDCKGRWAVVKDDGSTLACQDTKDMAIKQMVAVSLSDGIEPGGDWANRKKKKK